MTTIFAGLPFYDAVTKQDKNRTHSVIPFYCPTTHLPPFVICDAVAELPATIDYFLVSCSDLASGGTEITAYFSAEPTIVSTATNFYAIYDGTTLAMALPKGTYFLRADSSAGNSYYSEHFIVTAMPSGEWIKLAFSNTADLGDIPYSEGFTQIVYLNTKMNYPANEYIEVGEEKDGVFIAEKLVTKYLFRISDYVSRALHRVLVRLPQHDSITITDEVGNVYTPAVGNAIIQTSDWVSFETCHIVIQFNDGNSV